MTGNPTLDALLDALARDPHDEHSLCAFLDYLRECNVDHALNAVRLLAQESADACAARKRINRVRKEFDLFGKNEDALDEGLPRLIRLARKGNELLTGVGSEVIDE